MVQASNEKAFLETEKGDRLPCLFNPAELQVSRSNDWRADAMPGKGVPDLRYGGARSGTMRLSLFFDTTHVGTTVGAYTGKLLGLMEPDGDLPGADDSKANARPPWVRFHWGDLHSFKAVVSSLDISFVYFSNAGVPLRARAEMVLTQFEEDLAFGPQNPTSGTPRPHRVHRVSPGETLDRIAATHYGDATRWRSIAAANAIEDPLTLRPGSLLSIPKLEQ